MSKYPMLAADARDAGINYHTAYARLERGYSYERALSVSVQTGHRRVRQGPVVISKQDKSPFRIQCLRAALCDGFIKTGELDTGLLANLKGYADECRTANNDLARVSAEQEARCYRRAKAGSRDDGRRDDYSIDDKVAEHIRNFHGT